MKVDFKKIALIILASSAIGLLVNHINPDGISLIREQRKPDWADKNYFRFENDTTSFQNKSIENITENTDSVESDKFSEEDRKSDNKINTEKKNNENDFLLSDFTPDQPLLIDLEQAKWLYENGAVFIDARDSLDYERGHITNAINLPYYQFELFEYQLYFIDKNQIIVTYCDGSDCDLSIMLGDKLFNIGYKKVFVFYGGWEQWQNAGLPVNISTKENQ
ncbi:MAG: hypothetical protein Kow0098_27370 [Ignavibacteriaceae bacterium]